jgi:hypothetical protein
VSHNRHHSDAGKTVKADNVLLNEAMEKAGEHLNLASHLVHSHLSLALHCFEPRD